MGYLQRVVLERNLDGPTQSLNKCHRHFTMASVIVATEHKTRNRSFLLTKLQCGYVGA